MKNCLFLWVASKYSYFLFVGEKLLSLNTFTVLFFFILHDLIKALQRILSDRVRRNFHFIQNNFGKGLSWKRKMQGLEEWLCDEMGIMGVIYLILSCTGKGFKVMLVEKSVLWWISYRSAKLFYFLANQTNSMPQEIDHKHQKDTFHRSGSLRIFSLLVLLWHFIGHCWILPGSFTFNETHAVSKLTFFNKINLFAEYNKCKHSLMLFVHIKKKKNQFWFD